MKLFLASAASSATYKRCWAEEESRRFLFSFANFRALFDENRHLYDDPRNEIIVDSGAFTAWTLGRQLELHEYVRFCFKVLEHSSARVTFINLDVIPGRFRRRPTDAERDESARIGWRNFEIMRSVGLPVIHVFHQHEDFEWLRRIVDAGGVVGVSPANDVSVSERDRWLCKVYSTIGADVRTHAFGVTTVSLMENFPFYSVDSTSWLAPSLYWSIPVFAGPTRGLIQVGKADLQRRFGEVARHIVPATGGYEYLTRLSLRAYRQIESYITRLWEARGLKWEDDHGGRHSGDTAAELTAALTVEVQRSDAAAGEEADGVGQAVRAT